MKRSLLALTFFLACSSGLCQDAKQLIVSAGAKLKTGDTNGALADFTKAIELEPANDEAYRLRGLLRGDKRDWDAAISDHDKSIALKPDSWANYYDRGITKRKHGDLQGALADYNKAISLHPDWSYAYSTRGHTREGLGDLDGALADYDKALELDGNNVIARKDRDNLQQKQLSGVPGGYIGAELYITNGVPIIKSLERGMPAEKAGLQSGEKVLQIDRKSTTNLTLLQAIRLIRGAPGSEVRLTVQDAAGKKRKVALTRASHTLDFWKERYVQWTSNFLSTARAWREHDPKPELPEETQKQRILAENAVQEKRYQDALRHYQMGAKAVNFCWPQGNFNVATLFATIADDLADGGGNASAAKPAQAALDYLHAALYMRYYLELVPDAPNAQKATEKIFIWEDKADRLNKQFGPIHVTE